MALASCTPSTGSKMTIPGMLRNTPMSSIAMWVPPFTSAVTPGSLPTILTLRLAYAIEMVIWSQIRHQANLRPDHHLDCVRQAQCQDCGQRPWRDGGRE